MSDLNSPCDTAGTGSNPDSAGRQSGAELVSVVLPTWNRASWLAKAVDAVLRQTHANLELIIVDDGSTDDTPAVVSKIAAGDSRVRYLRIPHQGIASALNAGFSVSRGKYLTWISDDNYYKDDAFALMLRALNDRPEAGVVYCDFDWIDENGQLQSVCALPGPDKLWRQYIIGFCFLYRREVYEAVGDYSPDWPMVEDYEFFLRVREKFPIVHLPNAHPCLCTEHKQRLSHTRWVEGRLQDARIKRAYARSDWERFRVWKLTRYQLALAYYVSGDRARSVRLALADLLFRPTRRTSWGILLDRAPSWLKQLRGGGA